jgi:hypothetical protein
MSKHNKVNRDAYTQRGRLTPDEAARERMKQVQHASTRPMEGKPPAQLKATPAGKSEVDDDEDVVDDEQDENEHARKAGK